MRVVWDGAVYILIRWGYAVMRSPTSSQGTALF